MKRFLYLAGSLACVAALSGQLLAQAPPRRDVPKSRIETPTKRVLADSTKEVIIERPTAGVIANSTAAEDAANPRVEPGKVNLHASFTEACAAAEKSGKPVLLFQMMGKLDQKFC